MLHKGKRFAYNSLHINPRVKLPILPGRDASMLDAATPATQDPHALDETGCIEDALPNRANDRRLIELPITSMSRIDRQLPVCIPPYTDRALPKRTKLRIEMLLPREV